MTALAWDEGPPWTGHVHIEHDEAGAAFRLHGSLRRGDDVLSLSQVVLLLEAGLVLTWNSAARFDPAGAIQWLRALRAHPDLTVPFSEREQLRSALLASPPASADLPGDLRVAIHHLVPRPLGRRVCPSTRSDHPRRSHCAARPGGDVYRQPARLPARRIGLVRVSTRIRLRRLPGGRHGPRQDGDGARSARGQAAGMPRGRRGGPSVAGCRTALVIFNWRQEAARFTPELRVLDYSHASRAEQHDRIAQSDLVLATYGTLRRDAPRLADRAFDYLVLDEAQNIKNASTVTAKAVRLLKGDHRLALSGTPVENRLGDLWSLFEFLNPGLLSGASGFARLFSGRTLDEDS